MSGGTRFPTKFYPTGQDILSASRIICPGLGDKINLLGLILYWLCIATSPRTSPLARNRPGV